LKKIPIRDNRSSEEIKPRVLDYIKEDDGTELLEIKVKTFRQTILLNDLYDQIEKARNI